MQKTQRFWMIIGTVLLISVVGTGAVLAWSEGYQEELTLPAVRFGEVETSQMAFRSEYAAHTGFAIDVTCYTPSNCFKSTGRYYITYRRKSEGHWVTWCQLYVPDFIKNDKDAQKWRWSPEYIADLCSLPDEPQTWEGTYVGLTKETVPVDCEPICPIIVFF